jgi:hypothetical protein
MLDILFIIMNLVAFIFLYAGIEYEDDHVYWNAIMIFISWVLFLWLSATSTAIQIPYEIYNSTSGAIETGYHVYYTGDLMLVYFACFIVTLMYFLDLVFHVQLVKLFKRKA